MNTERFKNMSKKEINQQYFNASYNGDLALVKYLLESLELKYNASLNYGDGACIHAIIRKTFNLDVLRDYYYNPKVKGKHRLLMAYLYEACTLNDIDALDYLLNCKEFKNKIDVNCGYFDLLSCACHYGHFDIVKYLLTSPKLKKHVDIDNDIAEYAYRFNRFEIFKYLLSSPELKEHAKVSARILIESYVGDEVDFFNYLMFDYKIQLNQEIIDLIDYYEEDYLYDLGEKNAKDILEIFIVRDKENLDKILVNKETKKKPIKI